jgi:hypothetical protein
VFVVTLVVSAIVTLLWGALVRGAGAVDWETSFRAIVFGVVMAGLRRCGAGTASGGHRAQQHWSDSLGRPRPPYHCLLAGASRGE